MDYNDTSKIPSFSEYLKGLWDKPAKETDYSKHIKHLLGLQSILSKSPCIHFILDLHARKIVYVTDNVKAILGHNTVDLYNSDLSLAYGIVHNADLAVYSTQIFKDIYCFYQSLRQDTFKKYRYSYNLRVRRSDETYVHLLTHMNVLECDVMGIPTLIYGISSDISAYKKDSKITLSISGHDDISGFTEIHKHYFPDIKYSSITKRECEVLKLLMSGINSKHIAEKLKISEHTVKVHRKNMLEKTNSKNTAELVKVALNLGLI